MNNLDIYIIGGAYIKENSPLLKDVEDSFFDDSIINAQNIEIQSKITECLYIKVVQQLTDYRDYKIGGGTDTKEEYFEPRMLELIINHIRPALKYVALDYSAPFLANHITRKGFTKNDSENSVYSPKKEIDYIRKEWVIKSEHYMMELLKYINKNKTLFPEFFDCDDGCGDDDENLDYIDPIDLCPIFLG